MVAPVEVLYLLQTGLLLAASALLIYPVLAYARNVAYTEGVVALSASLFVLTVAYVLGALDAALWVRNAVSFLSAVLAGVGIWYFARSFVSVGDENVPVGRGDADDAGAVERGGFDSGQDD